MERELSKGKLIVSKTGAIGDYAGVEIAYITPSGENVCIGVIEEDNSSDGFVVMSRLYENPNDEPIVIQKVRNLINEENDMMFAIISEIKEYANTKGYYNVDDNTFLEICDIYMDCQEWKDDKMITGNTLEEISDFLRHSSEVESLLRTNSIKNMANEMYEVTKKVLSLKSNLSSMIDNPIGLAVLESINNEELTKEKFCELLLGNI